MMERINYTEEQLIDIIARTMSFGGGHFDDEARSFNHGDNAFAFAMESVSYTVSCWLAQYTVLGEGGVEWDVVYEKLLARKWSDPLPVFVAIATNLVKEFGGVNDKTPFWAKDNVEEPTERIESKNVQ